jgi:DNA repair exonuclease SbcCD ATPase subunit
MAVSKQEVIIEFNADTGGVEQSLTNVEKGVQDTSKATSGLTNQLDKMTGGAVSGFRSLKGGLKNAVTGMKTLKGAIAATGIGLLLVAITSLVSYFQKTERGAQQLRKITATLGAVMDKLVDIVIHLGEAIFNAFTNPKEAVLGLWEAIKTNFLNRLEGLLEFIPKIGDAIKQAFSGDFSGAAKTAVDAMGKVTLGVDSVTESMANATKAAGEFASEMERTAKAANDLADRENKLKVAERDHLIVRAETNKLIAEKRLLVEDEKMAFEDRIAALNEAIAAEQRTIAQELAFAKERADILEAKAALAESDEETLQAVAEARARVTELETSSLRTQKRLEGERQSLLLQQESREKAAEKATSDRIKAQEKAEEERIKKELEALLKENEAKAKLEDELYQFTLDAQEREELAVMQKYDERVAIAGDDEGLIRAATEQLEADLLAIQQRYDELANADEQKKLDGQIALLQKYYDEAYALIEENAVLTREQELENLRLDHEARILQAQTLGQETLSLQEALRLAEKEINERYDAEDKARRQQTQQAIIGGMAATLGLLSELNSAFEGDSEKERKKAFERQKKVQAAQALISTYESAIQAFNSLAPIPIVGPALGIAAAGVALASGLKNVQNIKAQQYQSPNASSGGGTSIGSISAQSQAQTAQAPQLDLSFLGEGAGEQSPVQAYVIATDVSNAQQANQQIQDQATL